MHKLCLRPLQIQNPADKKAGFNFSMPIYVPCGKCLHCLINRKMDWVCRCVNEMMFWENTYFFTLTFDDEHIGDNLLYREHLQKFFKRLRKQGLVFSYFACGEYGSKTFRRHYHFILYTDMELEKEFYRKIKTAKYYTSPLVQKCWTFGFSIFAKATVETIKYVAGYVLKKYGEGYVPKIPPRIEWQLFLNYYGFDERVDSDVFYELGIMTYRPERRQKILKLFEKWHKRHSEFILASRKPAIGYRFIYNYWQSVLDNGHITIDSMPYSIPHYYLMFCKNKHEYYYLSYCLKLSEKLDDKDLAIEQDRYYVNPDTGEICIMPRNYTYNFGFTKEYKRYCREKLEGKFFNRADKI